MMRKLLDLMIDQHLGFPEKDSAGVRLVLKGSPFGYGGAIARHDEIDGIYVFTTAIPQPDMTPVPTVMMFEADAVQWISVAPDSAVRQPDGDPNRTPGGVIIPSA